jgi:hypothetical protein
MGFQGTRRRSTLGRFLSESRVSTIPYIPSPSPPNTNINAYKAYQNRHIYGFYPGARSLDPYAPLFEKETPILAVRAPTIHDIGDDRNEICTCGDHFGSMTAPFASAVNLRPTRKQDEWRYFRHCLKRLKPFG